MTRRLSAFVILAIAAVVVALTGELSRPALAYLKLGSRVQNRTVSLRWQNLPIRYYVTDQGTSGVSATDFQGAVTRAFNTWNAVDTANTSSQFAGFTQARPFADDGMVVIGYMDRPDLERTLAATNFLVDVTDGEIVESDIFFNTMFPWSTASGGETGRFDVESIALHEIGHLHGLGHSALGETEIRPGGRRVLGAEAVMFPIAFSGGSIADRTLRADDVAGITDLYPRNNASSRRLGSITGKVTKNGAGVLGAHVVAFNPSTGALVGGFTLSDDGVFTIAGLEPGPHVLRVEPLDDGDVESFMAPTVTVDIDFRVRFHDRVVVVPRGGGTSDVEIKVSPK
jgi:matrixin/carboxypeptidase family protein